MEQMKALVTLQCVMLFRGFRRSLGFVFGFACKCARVKRPTGSTAYGLWAFLCVYVMLDSCFSIQHICEVLGLLVTVGQSSKVSRLISLSIHKASPWSSSRGLPIKMEKGLGGASSSKSYVINPLRSLTSGGSFRVSQ